MIVKASHRIAEGDRSTSFIARWLHAHEKSEDDESGTPAEDISKNNVMSVKKCRDRKVPSDGTSGATGDISPVLGDSLTANPNT